ncbi:hypothetical protein [Bosea sp. UC22_33]|uniref:hypothetical protein n=1 Tax=Bosea sp. UC22_33 TaxID=3350165 RepID=UPI00366DCF07
MKHRDLTRRIEALEEKAAAKAPYRQPETHVIHGDSRQDRELAAQRMIDRGEAHPGDIFFMVISSGEKLS